MPPNMETMPVDPVVRNEEEDAEWVDEPEEIEARKQVLAMSAVEASSRLERLLEKAGQYTKFLTRKLMPIPSVPRHEAGEENETETTPRSSKRRKTVESPKKTLEGAGRKKVEAPKLVDIPAGQPHLMTGGRLRDYQIAGYQWMVGLYENGLHGILADEMGLGKTVQTIALMADLRGKGVYGPFLLVVPLSTVTNWVGEIEKWVPTMPVLQYHGSKEEREEMRTTSLSRQRHKSMSTFPVVVTTYEIICRDRKELQRCHWKYIIVDEGHRLKNHKCRLVRELNMLCGGSVLRGGANKLLLTGTPLQNNLTELWSLLNFLMPEIFDSVDFFLSVFDFDGVGCSESEKAILNKQMEQNVVGKLHKLLAPFMMRRLKNEVEKKLPVKKEIVLYVPMTSMQRDMYQSIVKGELAEILKQCTGRRAALNNIVMQLRKCSLHPYLHYEATDSNGVGTTDESLVTASGKLTALDAMLKRLRANGNKVLIFSQFTTMLDIIQDYFTFLRPSWSVCRIDGTTKLEDRKRQMDDFNTDPGCFCFLLSTRAGGVGVNLIAADTVILFDSDWNPHQDNQAQDRCHRIGQQKDVVVYRMISSKSVELKVLDRANSKRKLERVVCAKQSTISSSASKGSAMTLKELKKLLENDFTGHLAEIGELDAETLCNLLDRDKVFDEGFPQKGKGYEIVEHKASSIVGTV